MLMGGEKRAVKDREPKEKVGEAATKKAGNKETRGGLKPRGNKSKLTPVKL